MFLPRGIGAAGCAARALPGERAVDPDPGAIDQRANLLLARKALVALT